MANRRPYCTRTGGRAGGASGLGCPRDAGHRFAPQQPSAPRRPRRECGQAGWALLRYGHGEFAMPALVSFDLIFLGLKDPSQSGRARFATAMSRLTGRNPLDFHDVGGLRGEPLFEALGPDEVRNVTAVLEEAGVMLEIRPVPGRAPVGDTELVPTQACPRCGFVQPAGQPECSQCGLVFAKWEREQVQKMQRERKLEETLGKLVQVREEWRKKAKAYLERHPLPEEAAAVYASRLHPEEVPFARLETAEGPILMTSRRMLLTLEGEVLSIPYEMIADVDVGGGFTLKKDQVTMQLKLRGPYPIQGSPKALKIPLAKESATLRDVVMDWAFARSFVCGACGEPDLDFRLQGKEVRARCMHCATDHEIDLNEAVAIPLVGE